MRQYFVLWNVFMITSEIRIILKVFHSFFKDDRYLPLGTFNVLIIQCVLLLCDQVCFGWATILTNLNP